MISSWTVYLVMQLDSISSGLTFLTCLGLSVVAVSILWNAISKADANEFPSITDVDARKVQWVSRDKWRNRTLVFVLPLFFINMLIPSSKTAAAMLVIPAIANNAKFRAEASDLYDLAKKGLEKVVAVDPPKKEEP